MERLTVDEVREIQMQIADEVAAICEAHGLTYYLSSGNLLGAARHKGFIPWDDDLDLMMLRDDYDTLVEHFDEWRSSDRFAIQAPRKLNSPNYMAKVIDTTTFVKQTYIREEYCSGLWVDIFPLDWVTPEAEEIKKRCYLLKRIGFVAATDPRSGSTLPIKLAKRIVCPIARLFVSPQLIANEVDSLSRAQSRVPSDAVCLYGGKRRRLLKYDYAWMAETVKLPFEDREYWAPIGYEECLTAEYGDWRTPVEAPAHFAEAYRL
ncbi:MAG: LicD family protein [Coriobacteriaceae bacterium]|nr:LicD family protein [Coriobacteriaceae bacterium]MDO4891560.1 LicD family protein [Coriobacteriaceae bacterium]